MFLAGFLPFVVLWRRIGVVWAFAAGVVVALVAVGARAAARRRDEAARGR